MTPEQLDGALLDADLYVKAVERGQPPEKTAVEVITALKTALADQRGYTQPE